MISSDAGKNMETMAMWIIAAFRAWPSSLRLNSRIELNAKTNDTTRPNTPAQNGKPMIPVPSAALYTARCQVLMTQITIEGEGWLMLGSKAGSR